MKAVRTHTATLMSILVALVGQSVLAVTGIIVARILGVENRGHLALLVVIPVILSQLCALGVPQSVTYYIARSPASAYPTFKTAVRVMAPMALLAVLVHLGVLLVAFHGQDSAMRLAGLLTLMAAPGWMTYALGLAILQGQRRFRAFNTLRLAQLSPYAAGVVALFALGSQSLPLVALVWAGSMALAGILTLAIAIRRLNHGLMVATVSGRALILFGVKGLPGQVSIMETFRLDQVVLGALAGPTALGLYVVGVAFANLPRFTGQSIGMIAYPTLASAAAGHGKRLANYVLLTLVVCGFVVAILELFAGDLVHLFFGPEFAGSVSVTRIILIGALFLGMRRVLSDCARGMGRPADGTKAELCGFCVGMPALAVMSLLWGADGAAGAVVVTSGVNLCMISYLTLQALSRKGEVTAGSVAVEAA